MSSQIVETCVKCGAKEGEVLPRNQYHPPAPRNLRTCALCHATYCDWCFGPHYCGEGEETAASLGVPEGYRIQSDEELDYL